MEPFRHETIMMDDYDIINDTVDTMMEIYDEYDGAKKYINEAIKIKSKDKTRADELVQMSAQELGHGEKLTAAVGKMLEKMKTDNNPCYDTLHLVWTRIKERQDGYNAWIKTMHERYKK